MIPHSILIFTDGSSRGNPGPGGFGAIIIAEDVVTEIGGREEHTTNNRMELRAAISALSFLESYQLSVKSYQLVVYTDSSYLINGITKWIFSWQKNNWKTTLKKDVENRDLWEQLVYSTIYRTIEWKYVGGHVGVAGNVRCDEIATAFADLSKDSKQAMPKLYQGSLENYPIRNILDIKHNAEAVKEKSKNRAHQKAKAYSYISMIGGVIQTHKTWAECETRVKGKKAKYKKVLSASEEQALMKEWGNTH